MNKYYIYLRTREKPIKVVADEWRAKENDLNYIEFLIDGFEVLRVDINEMIAMKKEAIT